MRNPEELFEILDDRPADTASPVLIYSLSGFVDAGQTGALAGEHLATTLSSRPYAAFDCDQLIDYRSRRPVMTFTADHYAHVERFQLTLDVLTDAAGTEFYLLRGPEPDFQWERFAAAVLRLVDRLGITRAVTGHGIPWASPHTRPLRMTAHASRRELISGSPRWVDDVRVPGNVLGLLELRLGEAGVDAIGFAVHVPHYLAEIEYPTAAVRLLEAMSEAAGVQVPDEALRAAGSDVLEKVDEQVAQAPQLQEAIEGMEKAFDADGSGLGSPGQSSVPESELPHGDDLAAEVEDFLRGMGGSA
ncbi:MAG: proteasome assembly chaperone family protein [Actinomycetales bacterium]